MIYVTVTEHFANLVHIKYEKLCFGPNALFWRTKVEKHPFYSIAPKMIYGSVIEHFANLRHVKDAKLVLQV
jgi:hypothetical protein